jgi:hypothetical protein
MPMPDLLPKRLLGKLNSSYISELMNEFGLLAAWTLTGAKSPDATPPIPITG